MTVTIQLSSKVTFAHVPDTSCTCFRMRPTCFLEASQSGKKRVWQLIKSLLQLYCKVLHLHGHVSCVFHMHLTHFRHILHTFQTHLAHIRMHLTRIPDMCKRVPDACKHVPVACKHYLGITISIFIS